MTKRFKNVTSMSYFDELQQRLREIRISERFFYQKIKDIYMTSTIMIQRMRKR